MSYSNFECGTCGKEFPAGLRARNNHCSATGHDITECSVCGKSFRTRRAWRQHQGDTNHWPFECSLCTETWVCDADRLTHERIAHCFCSLCDRSFNSDNDIKMHMNSRAHRGETIECPFCDRFFTVATGLTHHLESGACPNAADLDRAELHRSIHSRDPDGTISKHLATRPPKYVATAKAWNGDSYECYLCHRELSFLHGLNQHLSSPVHQQALYHCPNPDCGVDFRSLAATINHLESESCGQMEFEQVQSQIGDLVSGHCLISF